MFTFILANLQAGHKRDACGSGGELSRTVNPVKKHEAGDELKAKKAVDGHGAGNG